MGRIAGTFEVDTFLTLTTVSPDPSLDPSRIAEVHRAESRFLTLLRDQGDEAATYRFGEA